MFGMFGLGWAELIVLLLILLAIGVPIIVTSVVRGMTPKSDRLPTRKSPRLADEDDVAEIWAELKRLREEIEQLKKGPASQDIIADKKNV